MDELKTILSQLRLNFLYAADSLSPWHIVTIAWCYRIFLWLFMACICVVFPAHDPGDGVVRFPLDNDASSSSNCFSLVNTFCECGFDCHWTSGDSAKCFEKRLDAENLLQSYIYPFLLRPLTRWDAARFLRLALRPQMWQPHPNHEESSTSEEAHAFFPLFPAAVQHAARLLRYTLPSQALPSTCAGLLVLAAWIVNSACMFVAITSLYQTTLLLLTRHGVKVTRGRSCARRVVLLFVVNPANVFFVTAYSESLFAALVLTGSYFVLLWGPLGAMIPWCLATATRSNGILYFGYLLLYGVGTLFQTGKQTLLRLLSFLVCLMVGILILYPIYRHNQNVIRSHCDDETVAINFEWCTHAKENASLFYVYSYIQRKHWNVGLFRYYEWKQIPNFLLAAPILVLSAVGVVDWCRRSWKRAASADQKPLLEQAVVWLVESLRQFALVDSHDSSHDSATTTRKTPELSIDDILVGPGVLGHYAVWAVSALLGLTTAHVQISTRLLCSSCPALYWYAAHLVNKSEQWGSVYLAYCVVYIVLGGFLHPLWLPWT